MKKADKTGKVYNNPEEYPEFTNSGAGWRILMYICVTLLSVFVGAVIILMRVFGKYDGGIILLCVSCLFMLTGIAGIVVYCRERLVYRDGTLSRRSITGTVTVKMPEVKFCYASTSRDMFGRKLRICFLSGDGKEIMNFNDDGSAAGNARFMGLLQAYGVKILNDGEYIAMRQKERRRNAPDNN